MKQPLFIRIFNGDKLESIKQFQVSQIAFGANEQAQVRLTGDNISPLHALIEERDSGYYISDLGSDSGTRKNGQPVLDEKLESGDEIAIGSYRLQFFIGIPKPVAAPAPVAQPTPAAPAPQAAPPPAPQSIVAAPSAQPRTNPPTQSVQTTAGPEVQARPKATPKVQSHPLLQLKPGRGNLVEIVVAWRDRILSVHHFNERREITVGADPSADINVPLLGRGSAFPLVKIGALATVRITGQMSGDFTHNNQTSPIQDLLRQNRLRGQGNVFELDLNQGELVRIGFVDDLVSIYIRYTNETNKPFVAPLFDLTASEVTGVLLAVVVSAILSIYMMIYAPQNADEDINKQEEAIRIATVTFKPPKIVKPEEPTKPPPELPKEKTVVKMAEKTQEQVKPKPASKAAPDPGTAAEVAPKDTQDKQKKLTSAKPGGAIKTAPKEGANMKSEKPDPTKVGLLGVFGSKGALNKLDKAYSGSGELQGMADSATGFAGQAEDRPGEGIGSKLKDTGAGGKGTATVGIAGVGTKGKGSGTFGYGTGGLGEKGKVGINLDGTEAQFDGKIDREAILRVIRANKRVIQNCYNMALNRNPDLYGKVVLRWLISEKGRVKNAEMKDNTLATSDVGKCILEQLKTWKFPDPPPDTDADVSFPFVFTSQ